jgi:signal transduction histidine kinase
MKPEEFLLFAEPFSEPILLVSGDGVIHAANTAARELVCPEAGNLAGARIADLVTDSKESVQRFLTRCLRSRQMMVGSLTWSSSKGGATPTRAEGALLRPRTDLSGSLLIIRCVHKRTSAARFVALNDQISALGREVRFRKQAEAALLEQTERLARSNADLQQFAYVASHDLQEPLRTIAIFSGLLRKRYGDKLDGEANQFIEYVISASTRISALVRDILTYSGELNPENLPFADVDTGAVVDCVLNDLSAAIQESGAEVAPGHLPIVRAEWAGLVQVFQNLISNAIKYRGSDSLRIWIEAEDKGSEWVFSVADNGMGIAPEYRQTVFGLFKRLHRNEYPGTGIGLALCQKIVARHGGRIWIESARDGGSVFKFTIPVMRSS